MALETKAPETAEECIGRIILIRGDRWLVDSAMTEKHYSITVKATRVAEILSPNPRFHLLWYNPRSGDLTMPYVSHETSGAARWE